MTNPNSSLLQQKLDEIFNTLNGSGAHACYCERSVDGGCNCALKDEYIAEATQSIIELCKASMLDIVGEDERHYNGKKMVRPAFVCPDCGSYDEGFLYNQLRAELRQRIGEL